MPKPKNVSNAFFFDHDPDYIITPTYKTRAELDEKIQMLRQKSAQRGYSDRIPHCIFLQILGVKTQPGPKGYRNNVLLDTGVVHMVADKNHKPRYYYMQFTMEKSNIRFYDSFDPRNTRYDFNSFIG